MRGREYCWRRIMRNWTALKMPSVELNMAMTLRANEASILYNAACVFCMLKRKPEAMDALRKA